MPSRESCELGGINKANPVTSVNIAYLGEWKPLTVNIEGFTHREGVRNVLRVKQFQGPASTDGAPSNIYVLDLVVESETVKP